MAGSEGSGSGEVLWGVRYGRSSVQGCADGLSAFRLEAARRARGDSWAQACWSLGGGRWVMVDWDSPLRPDPALPAEPPWRPLKLAEGSGYGVRVLAWLCEALRVPARPMGFGWWRRGAGGARGVPGRKGRKG